ncbi:hypothetical protein BOS5A_210777 [Bosea sp. EC-HK365B]|nr:hypothetical protein BOSE7B_120638 [Bosea sp. 7B]CAD5275492.1 hypothetical protein BOSE21B_30272 [Bosea sp. 21B]VVT59986.1 hypothetical protein BOS5A_210777 [Bosea sp. EC-HK365B]VXC13030.1 hypothetical protein BOSE127_170279 [Bosea sp. 127]
MVLAPRVPDRAEPRRRGRRWRDQPTFQKHFQRLKPSAGKRLPQRMHTGPDRITKASADVDAVW